jgi:hypothetical protein
LIIQPYVTANNVNFMRCNPTAASITPTALTSQLEGYPLNAVHQADTDTARVTLTGKKILKAALLKLGAYDPDEELQAATLHRARSAEPAARRGEHRKAAGLQPGGRSVGGDQPARAHGGTGRDVRHHPALGAETRASLPAGGRDRLRTAGDDGARMGRLRRHDHADLAALRVLVRAELPARHRAPDYTPDAQYQIVFYKWKVLDQISDMMAALTLPPGYFRWLVYDLALDLRPEYPSATADMTIIAETARQAKAAIKRLNNKTPDIMGILRCVRRAAATTSGATSK